MSSTAFPEEDQDDDEDLLVSEFPPPPFYYRRASAHGIGLKPPAIPTQRLKEYSKAAAIVMKNAVAAMECKFRKEKESGETSSTIDDQDMKNSSATDQSQTANNGVDAQADLTASMVTVFGDVTVEDPILVSIPDDCSDPTKVRDNVIRLNRKVMHGYIKLVNELVHKPLDNKKCRDELSHNVLLMLHECNKFREHQARETLIQILEKQLEFRKFALVQLRDEINSAKVAMNKISEVTTNLGSSDTRCIRTDLESEKLDSMNDLTTEFPVVDVDME